MYLPPLDLTVGPTTRSQRLWWKALAWVAMAACLWSLVFNQPQPPSDPLAQPFASLLQFGTPQAQECGQAGLSCQDVAELEATAPEFWPLACRTVSRAPASLCHTVAQTALAPLERPPRLRA